MFIYNISQTLLMLIQKTENTSKKYNKYITFFLLKLWISFFWKICSFYYWFQSHMNASRFDWCFSNLFLVVYIFIKFQNVRITAVLLYSFPPKQPMSSNALFCYEISWLHGYPFWWYPIFIKSIISIVTI